MNAKYLVGLLSLLLLAVTTKGAVTIVLTHVGGAEDTYTRSSGEAIDGLPALDDEYMLVHIFGDLGDLEQLLFKSSAVRRM